MKQEGRGDDCEYTSLTKQGFAITKLGSYIIDIAWLEW